MWGAAPRSRRLAVAAAFAALAVLGGAGAAAPATGPTLLGSADVAPAVDKNDAGSAEAFRAVASASGASASLSVYLDASSTATSLVAGLYADAGGHPGALLGQGRLAAPVAGAWNDVPLAGVSVSAGTTYWIALLAPAGTLRFRDHCCGSGGSSPSEAAAAAGLGTLPAAWGSGASYPDGPVSAYVTAAPAQAPAPIPAPTPAPTPAPAPAPVPAPAAPAPPADAAPTAPTQLHAVRRTRTSIAVAWVSSPGAAGHAVYLDSAAVGTTTTASYRFTGLRCGRTYAVAVDAVDAAGHHSAPARLRAQTTHCAKAAAAPPTTAPTPAPAPAPTPAPAPAPAPPPTGPVSAYLAPDGSDANPCTQSQPCRSLERGYHAAPSGGRVELAAGLYGCDPITADPSKTADVVFAPAAGAAVATTCELTIDADHIEFDNLDLDGLRTDSAQHLTLRNVNVTCRDAAPYTLYSSGKCSAGLFLFAPASDFTMIGGSVGPTWDAPGAPGQSQVGIALGAVSGPSRNILFDGVRFHDNRRSDDLQHTSCLMLGGGDGVTIRNSTFDNCAVFDLFVTWWNFVTPQYPVATNVVLDHDTFAKAVAGCAGCTSGYYSVEFADYPPLWQNVTISDNVAYQAMHFDGRHKNFVVSGNTMPMVSYDCPSDITYRANVSNDGGAVCR